MSLSSVEYDIIVVVATIVLQFCFSQPNNKKLSFGLYYETLLKLDTAVQQQQQQQH